MNITIFGTNIIAFVIVLGILIFFHELGHFLVARLFKVGVEKFSLGFGPKLVAKTIGDTEYRISVVPLGGYVKMVGEEIGTEIDPARIPQSFTHKKLYQKMLIVAAGPLFNIVLAVLIFWGIFFVSGTHELLPTIGDVTPGAPAEHRLLKGDLVTAMNGIPVATWEDMAAQIAGSGGRPIHFTVKREDAPTEVDITPAVSSTVNMFGEKVSKYMIGVAPGGAVVTRKIGFLEAAKEGVVQTWRMTELTVLSIWKLVVGTLSRSTLGGPIMIAQMAGEQAREGAASLLIFIAMLSVNLGVINLFPIPVLDGGHILFFLIEGITRRPINARMQELAQQVGIFLLVLLMIYVFYNDINRLIFS